MQLDLHQLDLRYEGLRILDRGRQGRLTASLSQHGQQVPVVVVAAQEGRYVLVDGYARVAALGELARDAVDAFVLPVSEAEALMMCHRLETDRQRSALEEGWLLQTLIEEHGLGQCELAARLGRSESWVSRRLSLVRVLPEAAHQAVKEGRVPAQAAMKYLVPLSRDKRLSRGKILSRDKRGACERLVERLGPQPVTERELSRLYQAWRRADVGQRQRIVDHPRLYLKADEELSVPDPPEPDLDEARALLGDLEGVARLSRRGRGRLRRGALVQAEELTLSDVKRAFEEARLAFFSLIALIEEPAHDRPRHADGDPAPA